MIWSRDQATLAEVRRHFERVDFSPSLRARMTDEYIAKLLDAALRFEAWDQGELVAFCAIYANRPPVAFLSILTSERAGIAGNLLAPALEQLREFQALDLEVDPSNERAIRLYRRLQFEGDPPVLRRQL